MAMELILAICHGKLLRLSVMWRYIHAPPRKTLSTAVLMRR